MGLFNVTIDDAQGFLQFSPGWRRQPSGGSNNDQFLFSTYHASQTSGQTLTLNGAFNASSLYIYGSKGVGYGSISVQINGLATLASCSLPSGSSPSVLYRQLLWSGSFPWSAPLVILKTTSPSWVDIDYIVLTENGPDQASDPGSFATTSVINAPPSSSSNSAPSSPASSLSSSSSSSPSPQSPSADNAASSTTVPVVLAGLFGGLLLFFLLLLFTYWMLKRRAIAARERERAFRVGPSPFGHGHSHGSHPGSSSNNATGIGGGRSGTPTRSFGALFSSRPQSDRSGAPSPSGRTPTPAESYARSQSGRQMGGGGAPSPVSVSASQRNHPATGGGGGGGGTLAGIGGFHQHEQYGMHDISFAPPRRAPHPPSAMNNNNNNNNTMRGTAHTPPTYSDHGSSGRNGYYDDDPTKGMDFLSVRS